VNSIFQDLKYGFRTLGRSSGFTAVAILSLVGIVLGVIGGLAPSTARRESVLCWRCDASDGLPNLRAIGNRAGLRFHIVNAPTSRSAIVAASRNSAKLGLGASQNITPSPLGPFTVTGNSGVNSRWPDNSGSRRCCVWVTE